MIDPRPLDGGLVLRAAQPGDDDGIVRLSAEAHGEPDGRAVRRLLEGDGWGPGEWLVVVDGERVVSTCTLLEQTLRVGAVELPVGQVEYVATDPSYRRRGLVTALFAEHHRRSAELGHLVNLVYGIPYFYRRLGYGYGLGLAPRHLVPRPLPTVPDELESRPATVADLEPVVALDREARAAADIALLRTNDQWRWLLEHHREWNAQILVTEDAGKGVVAWARLHRWEEDGIGMIDEIGAGSTAGARSSLAAAAAQADDLRLWARDRHGTPVTAAVFALTEPDDRFDALYVRFPDPVATLDALRPVLSERLETSPLRGEVGALDISLYDAGIRLHYEEGKVVGVEAIPGEEDPLDEEKAGVAPDALPALVLGRFDPGELRRRHDDVDYGRDRALIEVLFPRQTADVLDVL